MGYVKDAMIDAMEAGAVLVEMSEVRELRAAGCTVPLVWVTINTYRGKQMVPAVSMETVSRLAENDAALPHLSNLVERLREAVEEIRDYRRATSRDPQTGVCLVTRGLRRQAASIAVTASRVAAEIVAAVAAGDEMPDEWHRYDTYADCGEPVACEVVRLVREELLTTGIRV
jgi:hypothetical protein